MYLKKVEIYGFKSFADRIEVEFETGVTGIVGPNGSGKSNISDAVRWVLGEQSAKTLRGSKMEDVIFAGTTQRKPVGMAEVSLTLDNSKNVLPVDYSEVTVTRRVYRSGESEYYINKTPCRLRDIREMLMDTGIGIDGYSIIGQGRIDEILSNKSEDRRLLFEEAAGIVKYKARKEDAEKKLDNTNQNLTRINDIVQELENRIEPLKIQSEKARIYGALKEELKNIEINSYAHELEELKNRIEMMKEQEEIIIVQLQRYDDEKKGTEEEHKALKQELEKLEGEIQHLQNNIFETSNLLEKKEGELSLFREKLSNIQESFTRLSNEICQGDKVRLGVEKQLEEKEVEFKNIQRLSAEDNQQRIVKENELGKLTQILVKHEQDMEISKGNIIELLNQMADKKNEINSLVALISNLSKRCQQLQGETTKLKVDKEDISSQIAKKNQEARDKLNRLEQRKKEANELKTSYESMKQSREDAKEKTEASSKKIHEIQTKKNLLSDMQKDYEGFNKSVKNTLQETKKDVILGKNIYGVVAELIKVPKELEIGIEVALGGSLQNIVCQDPEDANRVIDYLKKNNLGRVTFLPISSLKTSNNFAAGYKEEIRKKKGFLGYANEMISCEALFKDVFQYLLGKVILVDKIQNGIEIAKHTSYRFKIVSLEGDIINPGGAITGGSYHAKTVNFLSRKREIEELEHWIVQENTRFENYKSQLFNMDKELVLIQNKIEVEEVELKEAEIEIIRDRNVYEQFLREERMYHEQIEKNEREIGQLKQEQEEIQDVLKTKEKEIMELQQEQDSLQNRVSTGKDSYDAEKEQREKILEELTNLKIRIASREQQIQNFEQIIKDLKSKIIELEELKKLKKFEIEELDNNNQIYQEKIDGLKIELKDGDILKQQYQLNLSQIKSNKLEINKRFEEVASELEKINTISNELQDSRYKMEVKRARLELQQESFTDKLWEEYEITYLEAMNYKTEVINQAEAAKTIKQLKDKIKDLGTVNLDAIQEYEEVIERYNFLTLQRTDLLNAKDALHKVIKDMENTMKEQFITYFEIIKENFDGVFKKLFGGGKAELRLIDESNVLTTGIEINAQPPGKKLQHLSLLSGGERALTAISLLFAILKVKPTPFCILDEIEAALDDANVYRYAEFLKEFSKETQFIVVTHRKGTMESVDALYGVTMQEHGVSKLISVRLADKAS